MKLLLIHQNFPGQLRHIAEHLKQRPDIELLAVGRDSAPGLAGIKLLRYRPHRGPHRHTHPYLHSYEDAVLHGQAVLRALQPLQQRGYRPDAILAHPGWGETLFLKDLFPAARLIHYSEYYYHGRGADADFDPEFPLSLDGAARLRARNALHLLNLEHADHSVTPTHWQHSLHPAAYRPSVRIQHEGIRTELLGPDPSATLTLPNGRTLRAGQPIVSYVARNLEPYRGFHTLMRALPALLRQRPDSQIVIVGGDGVSYGSAPRDAAHWREKLLRENPVDPERVHFLGKVPYDVYRQVLQVSAVHVYLTYPFVLSWSLLEAMASGCRIVASDTAPVREVIRDGENGELTDFFDAAALAEKVGAALETDGGGLRLAARETAVRYSVEAGLAGYRRLLGLPAE
ncbi:glycosyltransferase family 4 protein [Chromobacterium haemolyticum]|uniref:Glycosyltransferase family 4 protein n=1 Tax=Chromobacterium haemolyticum TaxID=394935 RepID=A0ABS3GQ31_9NEIS|nr:glycosyltransferase family 4 protein [Chromobacterium haemolyticum]MBK0415746.1 glycosyltransferase family 4 protein [Chromobacterium haemolyticum]MBO0417160.1 glycosyltransferase family 4 protein [Chromobacterium haemolyticum]MBO0500129.1 glycosyltransferase family 4 protein [Chromobacterium haemolyticum]